MCRIASATSAVEVGQPRWSATKRSSSRSRGSRSTVLRSAMPCADRLFSSSLGAAIDAERRHPISLEVSAGLGAIEHVIGRDMHKRDAGGGTQLGKNGGPLGIAPDGFLDLALGGVDLSVGRGVDNQARSGFAERAFNCRPVRHVGFASRESTKSNAAMVGEMRRLLPE